MVGDSQPKYPVARIHANFVAVFAYAKEASQWKIFLCKTRPDLLCIISSPRHRATRFLHHLSVDNLVDALVEVFPAAGRLAAVHYPFKHSNVPDTQGEIKCIHIITLMRKGVPDNLLAIRNYPQS